MKCSNVKTESSLNVISVRTLRVMFQVVILDGQSGDVLWEVDLLAVSNSPRPGSVYTTKSISVFMFWGLMPSNSSVSILLLLKKKAT